VGSRHESEMVGLANRTKYVFFTVFKVLPNKLL